MKKSVLFLLVLLPVFVFAEGEPINFAAVSAALAPWASTAINAGVVVLSILIGIPICKRVFSDSADCGYMDKGGFYHDSGDHDDDFWKSLND